MPSWPVPVGKVLTLAAEASLGLIFFRMGVVEFDPEGVQTGALRCPPERDYVV